MLLYLCHWTPDSSSQKSFLFFGQTLHFYQRFVEFSYFSNQFLFPSEVRKSGFHCIYSLHLFDNISGNLPLLCIKSWGGTPDFQLPNSDFKLQTFHLRLRTDLSLEGGWLVPVGTSRWKPSTMNCLLDLILLYTYLSDRKQPAYYDSYCAGHFKGPGVPQLVVVYLWSLKEVRAKIF